MGFAKLLISWVLSMMIYACAIQAWDFARGQATGGFLKGIFLGLGILLAIPTFLFALIVGWPVMSWLVSLRPVWLIPFLATVGLAFLMWVLTSLMLPEGWRGAGHALIGYAAVLGLVWACLNLATVSAK